MINFLFRNYLLSVMLIFCFSSEIFASSTCVGRFVNPITEISWSCVLPIQLGPVKIGGFGGEPKTRDTKNPSCPICFCKRGIIPFVPGIPLAFWEPIRIIDITRTPLCMVNLGGIHLGSRSREKLGGWTKGFDEHFAHRSFYHLHYYVYPLIYLLEVIANVVCLEKGTIDLLYLSEFDPAWNDEVLQNLMYPDSILFANVAAQVACTADCVASSFGMPIDSMYFCSGCHGNMFPIAGGNADHAGGVRTSILLAMRALAKLHRAGIAEQTATTECNYNGKLCKTTRNWFIKKSQYKLQMTYPKFKKDNYSCIPLGMTDLLYSINKEYPFKGEDWGYILWRKRNCCFL